jgi:hypothetical protein
MLLRQPEDVFQHSDNLLNDREYFPRFRDIILEDQENVLPRREHIQRPPETFLRIGSLNSKLSFGT